MSINKRILEIMEQKQIKPSVLAEKTGIRPSTISEWKNRGNDPQAKYIFQICEILGVSVEYILTGKESEEMTENDQRILKLYKSATDAERLIIDTALNMVEKRTETKQIEIKRIPTFRNVRGIAIKQVSKPKPAKEPVDTKTKV